MPQNYNLYLKGTVGGWDFNADMVNYVLDKHKGTEVHVLIDSLGGYTSDAVSISSLFKLHGNVSVHFVGYNASAATIAAMGAKHISIDEDAAFLVHKCMSPILEWAYMNADELDEHIKKLEGIKKDNETIDSCIAGMYSRRCKKSKDELLALMKVGGWLTPEQALEWGFVDEITRFKEDKKAELSEATLSSLSAAGIPLPHNIKRSKGSLLDRFLAFLQSSASSNLAPADEPAEAATISPLMANLDSLSGLLGGSLSLSDDGALSLSQEQAATVNDKIKSLSDDAAASAKAVADLQAEIADLRSTVDELRKQPADTTSTVVDASKDADPYAPVSDAEAIEASKAFLGIL